MTLFFENNLIYSLEHGLDFINDFINELIEYKNVMKINNDLST